MKKPVSKAKWILWGLFALALAFLIPSKNAAAFSVGFHPTWTQIHDGTVGEDYYAPVYVTNGIEPFTVIVSEGALPDGLTVHWDGAFYAQIDGKPTKTGTFKFILKAEDSDGNVGYSPQYTIVIAPSDAKYQVSSGHVVFKDSNDNVTTSFKAGERVYMNYDAYIATGEYVEEWVSDDIELDWDYSSFYMPAHDVAIEPKFAPLNLGSVFINAAGSDFSVPMLKEREYLSLKAAYYRDIVWGECKDAYTVIYGFASIYKEKWVYNLDRDTTPDLSIEISEYSTGQKIYMCQVLSTSSLSEEYDVIIPQAMIDTMYEPVYSKMTFFFGHVPNIVGGYSPTCTAAGMKEHYECGGCGKWFWDLECTNEIEDHNEAVIPANGHKMSLTAEVKPTCDQAGAKPYYTCSVCGKLFWDEKGTLPIANKDDIKVPALSHDLKFVEFHASACEKEGNKDHYECQNCGKWFWDSKALSLISDHSSATMPALSHVISIQKSEVAPTCTKDGIKEHFICIQCEKWFFDVAGTQPMNDASDWTIPKLGHDMVYHAEVPADCGVNGSKAYYECTRCQTAFWDEEGNEEVADMDELIIPALTHSFTHYEAVSPDCENSGLREHYECSTCGRWYWDQYGLNLIVNHEDVPAAAYGHNPVKYDAVEPTCTADGSIEFYICNACGKWFSDEACTKEIADHDDAVIPAPGHDLELIEEVPAGCLTKGMKAHQCCKRCGKLFETDENGSGEVFDPGWLTIPATSHDLTHVEGSAPSCGKQGVIEHYECEKCGKWYWDAVAASVIFNHDDTVLKAYEHSLTLVEGSEATCTADGRKDHYECANCKEWFWDAEASKPIADHDEIVIGAKGHNLTHITARESTCSEAGVKEHYECSSCGVWFWDAAAAEKISDKDETAVPALPHTLFKTEGSAPSCTADGNMLFYECRICGQRFWDENGTNRIPDLDALVIEAPGHMLKHVEGVPAGCTEDGVKEHYVCEVCGKTFWDEEASKEVGKASDTAIPAQGHRFILIEGVLPSCETEGVIEHRECTECGKWYWDAEGTQLIDSHDNVIRAALGHNWSEWTVLKAATADEGGLAERTCLNDLSHHEYKDLLPLNHQTEPVPSSVIPPETSKEDPTVPGTSPEATVPSAQPTSPAPSSSEAVPTESAEEPGNKGGGGSSILPWILVPVGVGAGVGGGIFLAGRKKPKIK